MLDENDFNSYKNNRKKMKKSNSFDKNFMSMKARHDVTLSYQLHDIKNVSIYF